LTTVPFLPVAPARTQVRDEAASYIRELIVSGQASPGQLLRLAPLAEQIGASITPVREALLLLAQDGWVVQEPNRGFRIAAIRRGDVEDAYLVQSLVAGELAARAAVAIDDDALQTLRDIDAEIQRREPDEGGTLEAANHRLHATIYAAGDSARLIWFVDAASRFVPRRFWGAIPGWHEHNRSGHAPIIDALAAHDPERSRAAMSGHLTAAGQLLVAHLDAIGFWEQHES
jgi:DNA-binding GntR family transcriptional regulator